MKRFVVVLAMFLSIALSCDRYYESPDGDTPSIDVISGIIPGYVMSEIEVAEYAAKVPRIFSETKAEEKGVENIAPITAVWSFDNEDSLSEEARSLLSEIYIVNYKNNGGFAIICADNRSEQVLAFSDCGNLSFTSDGTKSGIYSNDGSYTIYDIIDLLPYYVQGLSKYIIDFPENLSDIDSLDANGYYFANPSYYYSDWVNIAEETISTARWGQGFPYNYYCPVEYNNNTGAFENDLVGCNAVAIGEVMYCYSYPDSLIARYCATAGSKVWIPWQSSYSFVNNSSMVIADLLRQIADKLPTQFGLYESDAYFNLIPSTLAAFNYSCNGIQTYSFDRIVQGISTYGTPILIYGANSSLTSAHTWVIDGYRKREKYWLCDWDVYGPDGLYKGRWTSRKSDYTTSSNYVYCNWGWNGQYNGYYTTALFNPGGNNYSYNCHIFTNVKPSN